MKNNEILFIQTERIPDMTLKGNVNIRKICIGENVKSINPKSLSMCSNLESIEVDENNERFTSANNCNAIIDKTSNTLIVGCYKTEIPEYVTEIGPFAFCGQTKLDKITIPPNVTKINAYAFEGCSDVTELKIPNSVKYIGQNCFRNCTNFKTIYLPNTKIDMDATVFGVVPYNWDGPDDSTFENIYTITPHFKGVTNIIFEGTLDEYYLNGPFVDLYISGSQLENTHILCVRCKDGQLTYNKWGFNV